MKMTETLRELEKQISDIDRQIRDLEYRKRTTIEIRNRLLEYLRDED